MLQTFEAVINEGGYLQFSEPVNLTKMQRVWVIFTSESPLPKVSVSQDSDNPLINSIVFEHDIVSPFHLTWQAET